MRRQSHAHLRADKSQNYRLAIGEQQLQRRATRTIAELSGLVSSWVAAVTRMRNVEQTRQRAGSRAYCVSPPTARAVCHCRSGAGSCGEASSRYQQEVEEARPKLARVTAVEPKKEELRPSGCYDEGTKIIDVRVDRLPKSRRLVSRRTAKGSSHDQRNSPYRCRSRCGGSILSTLQDEGPGIRYGENDAPAPTIPRRRTASPPLRQVMGMLPVTDLKRAGSDG